MSNETFGSRLKHAWNAFFSEDQHNISPVNMDSYLNYGVGSIYRQDLTRLSITNERTIIASLYNRIATDVATVSIKHAKIDKNGRYLSTIDSGLNRCLTFEANIDQTGREFIYDATLSMFENGHVALVPVDTNIDINNSNTYDIVTMRSGKVVQWYPRHVRVDVYNDKNGQHQEVTLPKTKVAIIQNPFYIVMNEPNSTLKRLTNKLNLLDITDNRVCSGKMDLIIQLPYVVKGETRESQAEKRRSALEAQLEESKYGIGYIGATEKIVQLNRSIDNNLLTQIEDLTSMLYSQLGITKSIFDGTADEKTMVNYYNTAVEPVLSAFADNIKRTFLTKTARSQGQSIVYVRDPFKLVTLNEIADIGEKFTRNEILSPNEIRCIMGFNPIDDQRADELRNRNLNASEAQISNPVLTGGEEERYD